MNNITSSEYVNLEQIYIFLNKKFFNDVLPSCLITLQRKSKAAGYYSKDRFVSRENKDQYIDEIALNPAAFKNYSDIEIVSTLAHEMTHKWQFSFGSPSRSGYHNKEFSEKMKEIGLQTSDTGKPGGKPTGQRMSDYIIPGGIFETTVSEYLKDKKGVSWQSIEAPKDKKPKTQSKIKYSCPECTDLNVWGKPGILVKCAECDVLMISQE